ncbi:MAG: hypothetical protein SOZ63_01805 [Eggerthellaceae bacterium]|nr:hypothetical protein [Eggerthellaceae bacterium]
MARIKVNFTAEEKKLLKRLDIAGSFNSLSLDDLLEIDNAVTELLMDEGIDDEGKVNALGRVCEGIIEKLADES